VGNGFEVALGGGRQNFFPKETRDPEDPSKTGARTDHRNLAEEWTKQSNNSVVVFNQPEFAKLDPKTTVRVLGLFEHSNMNYEADRAKDKGGEPSLAEMTRFAIDRLSQNEKGFVLLVEGGRIDQAHHEGNAAHALEETIALNVAIKVALEKTKREDTLIIVTADHSHTMTISGYPKRGNPILGVVADADGQFRADDGKPYTTLAYANGPGSVVAPRTKGQTKPIPIGSRADPSKEDTTDRNYRQQSTVPLESETHGGDDVAIYAWGPQADLFRGTVEQNYIYHVMAHALGL
jgi:alkaline phosphatase